MTRPRQIRVVILAIASCLGATPAGAATRPRGITYGGLTSKRDPIVFKLSRDGRHVVKMVDMWEADCSAGGSIPLGTSIDTRLNIDKHGRFSAEGSHGITLDDGTWFLEQHSTGTVNGHAIAGTWTIDLRRYDQTGMTVDDCTANFTYRARAARGEVYGGATSQDLPVVIRVGPTKVRRIDFGWSSICRSGTFLQLPGTMSSLKLTGGRFRYALSVPSTGDQGEKLRLGYGVLGRVTPGRATGRLRVRFTVHDAAGNLANDCRTGSVSYTAASG